MLRWSLVKPCAVCGSDKTGLFCPVEDRDHPGVRWEIWRCSNCGYGWTLPWIGPERIGEYYPPAYLGDTRKMLDGFSAGTLQKTRSWRRMSARSKFVDDLVGGGRILDVGCSNGDFLLTMDPAKWDRYGVEYIVEVVEMVQAHLPELKILAGDIYRPDLPPNSFDVITFWHVLEHLHETRRVLARARELLKPGGWIVIAVPNFHSYQAEWFRAHWYAFDVPRHLHHFSPRSLEILLDELGMVEVRHHAFCRFSNMHQLKYSLIHWSEARFASRFPYYCLKPLLFGAQALESRTKKFGSLATVARSGSITP